MKFSALLLSSSAVSEAHKSCVSHKELIHQIESIQ